MNAPAKRFVLRDLPLTARVVIAVFLLAVGLGYFSALVQLHFQQGSPTQPLPGPPEVVKHFHGTAGPPVSAIERLITADEKLPFNGTGSMAAAFTFRSGLWDSTIKEKMRAENLDRAAAESALRRERNGEKKALLAWLAAGLPEDAFTADKFLLPADLVGQPVTSEFLDGQAVKIKTLVTERCTRCHSKGGDDAEAANFPMETLDQIRKYAQPESGGAVSLVKLAQTTHAHLLSFAMLFALTGLVTAFTSYPVWIRLPLAPLVLIAQVADISCWWLARLDGAVGESFARAILFTGAVVGGGLALQIVLSLFDLFGAVGKVVLVLILAVAGYGGYELKQRVIDPHLNAAPAAEKVN